MGEQGPDGSNKKRKTDERVAPVTPAAPVAKTARQTAKTAAKKIAAKKTAVKGTTARGTAAKKTAAKETAKPPANESRTALVRRARRINRELAEVYPYAHPELDFDNPFQLLVATVLSAQTTDLRVNQTTPALFSKYPTPEDLAAAIRRRSRRSCAPAASSAPRPGR